MARRLTLILFVAAIAAAACAPQASAAGYVAHRDVSYDRGSPPPNSALNQLDLYEPIGFKGKRPVAVYAHGGAWSVGDKGNKIDDKARLFTNAGYVFVSINYRLSPRPPQTSNPSRVMFPDHPHDVGEAIGWLSEEVASYGGDSDRLLLLGHSAGAHLVSLVATDPSYLQAYGAKRKQISGVVSLDTAAFDIASRADPAVSTIGAEEREGIYWNAFGTPAENAATGSWATASPLLHADPKAPPFLLVTQNRAIRREENREMAEALGQDPDGVVAVDATHEQINEFLGGASDSVGETDAVMSFANAAVNPPRARIEGHPKRRLHTRRARFMFKATVAGSSFECRIDGRGWRQCSSPKGYRVRRGRHTFRVRAANEVAVGPAAKHRFRVVGA